MAKKNSVSAVQDNAAEVEQKTKNNCESNTATCNPITVVLKADFHCEGCKAKIIRCVSRFKGVIAANIDTKTGNLSVIGHVDPLKIREHLENKINAKVDLVSPRLNKQKQKNKDDKKPEKENYCGNKNTNHSATKLDSVKKTELPESTVVLKLGCFCRGCIEKARKVVLSKKGADEIEIDEEKSTVTIKGKVDVCGLKEQLKEKLKRAVENVTPRKEETRKVCGGGGGSCPGSKNKNKSGCAHGGGKENANPSDETKEECETGYCFTPVYGQRGHPCTSQPVNANTYEYGLGLLDGFPIYMKLNDENPNACSIM